MSTLVLDFETVWSSGLRPPYSLKRMGVEAYVRDPRFGVHMVGMAFDGGEPVVHQAGDVADALAAVDWARTVLVSHNAMFDGSILHWHYGHRPLLHIDTLALSRLCYPRVTAGRRGLGEMCRFLQLGAKGTELALSDGVMEPGGFNPFVRRRMTEYCAQDVRLTWKLYRRLLEALARMEKIADRPPGALRAVEMGAIDDCVRMTTEPALVLDQAILGPVAEAEKKAADGRLRKDSVFAEELRALGLEPGTKQGKRGRIAAFAKTDTFMRALLADERPEVRALAAARLAAKGNDESKRAQSLLAIAGRGDGALPALLNYHGTHTGRDTGGGGINLQNLPRESEIRRAIRAPQGAKLVVADLSQIEVRVLAHIAGEDWLIKAFRAGDDPYIAFAARMEGIAPERVTEDMRQTAKSAYLGLNYGMGNGVTAGPRARPAKPGTGYLGFVRKKGGEITPGEAVRVHGAYRKAHPNVVRLWGFSGSCLRHMARLGPQEVVTRREMPGAVLRLMKHRIHLPSGRVLWYPGLRNLERRPARPERWEVDGRDKETHPYGGLVAENVIQAVARDVLWEQIEQAKERLGGRARVMLRVHDEVVMLVPRAADAPFVKGVLEEEMTRAPDWMPGVPLGTKAKIAESWLEAK